MEAIKNVVSSNFFNYFILALSLLIFIMLWGVAFGVPELLFG